MAEPTPNPAFRAGRLGTVVFVAFMLALTVVFAALGLWQWQRLGEKEALIAAVESRQMLPPEELPPASAWATLDTEALDYRPLSATGTYRPAETVLVFTSLGAARGPYSGPGYWVMTPLVLEDGGTLFVNRGFVPQDRAADFADGGTVPEGEVTVSGTGRASEATNAFTPAGDAAARIDYVRNVERLAANVDPALAPFAPVYLDLPAGDPGSLPQGGETVVTFPNNHLGYAMTWFGFAVLTPALLAFWLLRRRPSQH